MFTSTAGRKKNWINIRSLTVKCEDREKNNFVSSSTKGWKGKAEREGGESGEARRDWGPYSLLSSNDLWEAEGSLSLGGDLVYMLQGSSL